MYEKSIEDIQLTQEIINEFRERIGDAKRLMAYYSCAMMEIETKFKVLNKQFSLQQSYNPIETIKTRLKSPESIVEKLYRKHSQVTIEQIEAKIHDVAGIRVICPFITDIYMIADCLLDQDDVRLVEKKDYIKHPKETGYRSLHLIVETPIFLQNEKKMMKVEIQFRTIAMDFWASLEHRMRYKKDIPPFIAQELAVELRKYADESAKIDRRMEEVKDKIEESKVE